MIESTGFWQRRLESYVYPDKLDKRLEAKPERTRMWIAALVRILLSDKERKIHLPQLSRDQETSFFNSLSKVRFFDSDRLCEKGGAHLIELLSKVSKETNEAAAILLLEAGFPATQEDLFAAANMQLRKLVTAMVKTDREASRLLCPHPSNEEPLEHDDIDEVDALRLESVDKFYFDIATKKMEPILLELLRRGFLPPFFSSADGLNAKTKRQKFGLEMGRADLLPTYLFLKRVAQPLAEDLNTYLLGTGGQEMGKYLFSLSNPEFQKLHRCFDLWKVTIWEWLGKVGDCEMAERYFSRFPESRKSDLNHEEYACEYAAERGDFNLAYFLFENQRKNVAQENRDFHFNCFLRCCSMPKFPRSIVQSLLQVAKEEKRRVDADCLLQLLDANWHEEFREFWNIADDAAKAELLRVCDKTFVMSYSVSGEKTCLINEKLSDNSLQTLLGAYVQLPGSKNECISSISQALYGEKWEQIAALLTHAEESDITALSQDRFLSSVLSRKMARAKQPELLLLLFDKTVSSVALAYLVQCGSFSQVSKSLEQTDKISAFWLEMYVHSAFLRQDADGRYILQALIESGAKNGLNAYHEAIDTLSEDQFLTLLDLKHDLVKQMTPAGQTLLRRAASRGYNRVVARLLELQADYEMSIDGAPYKVIKSCMANTYFEGAASGKMNPGVIETNYPDALKRLLLFLHTGKLDITHDTFKVLAMLASYYVMGSAQELLQAWLHEHRECAHWSKYLITPKRGVEEPSMV